MFHEREVRLTTLPGAVVRASVPAHECIVVKEPPYAASESFSLSVRDPGSFIVSGIHRHLDETTSSNSFESLFSFLSNVRFGIKFIGKGLLKYGNMGCLSGEGSFLPDYDPNAARGDPHHCSYTEQWVQ